MGKLREQGFRTVVAAAHMEDNKVWLAPTHWHLTYGDYYLYDDIDLKHQLKWGKSVTRHGFLDSAGRYVNKQTAWEIAERNGLLDENPQSFSRRSDSYFEMCGSEIDMPYAREILVKNYKLKCLKTKEELAAAVFKSDAGHKNEKLNKWVTDYLDRFMNLKDAADAQNVIRERVEDVVRR